MLKAEEFIKYIELKLKNKIETNLFSDFGIMIIYEPQVIFNIDCNLCFQYFDFYTCSKII